MTIENISRSISVKECCQPQVSVYTVRNNQYHLAEKECFIKTYAYRPKSNNTNTVFDLITTHTPISA